MSSVSEVRADEDQVVAPDGVSKEDLDFEADLVIEDLPYEVHDLGNNPRQWATLNLPLYKILRFTESDVFSGNDPKRKRDIGEQRKTKPRHVKLLREAMINGHYTPASVTFGLRSKKCLEFHPEKKTVTIRLNKGEALKRLDGGHRIQAIKEILETIPNPDMQNKINRIIFPGIIQLNGNTQEDFVRLQAGAAVDKTLLESLRINGEFDLDPKMIPFHRYAKALAKELANENRSPIKNLIRFDTMSEAKIGLASLTKIGAADAVVSLIGTAKIVKQMEYLSENENVAWMFQLMADVWQILQESCEGCVGPGRALSVTSNKIFSVQLFIGVCNVVAYRLLLKGSTELDEQTKLALIGAVNEVFDCDLDKGWSSTDLRKLMGEFTTIFFEDYCESSDRELAVVGADADRGGGIPISLCKTLSYSTFYLTDPEKGAKKRKATEIDTEELNKIAEEAQTAEPEVEPEPEIVAEAPKGKKSKKNGHK